MTDSTFKDAKILIVDDKQANIDILLELLEVQEYTKVQATTDPRLVVSIFESFKPDLILLDMMMPYLSGFEVMEQLKTLVPGNTFLPILVLTADISQEMKQRALSGGAKDFLAKPFDLNEVSLRIKNLLETRYYYQLLENQNQVLEEKVRERTLNLQKANHELDLANNELKTLDKAKFDFLKLISHEIRTPLNGIKGFTDILRSEISEPELLEYLEFLESSVTRLEKFSYVALLITELQTCTAEIQTENVPVCELFNHSKSLYQEIVRSKKLNVRFQKDPSITVLNGNGRFLQVCFDSLADNAFKYSSPGDDVIVKADSDDEFIIIEFIDHGPGFSSAALDNLYKLFWVGDGHVDKNTGLNLALIKLIMDAHHGRIEVLNNQTKGATVRLKFKKI
jgi:two-component system sensor histidine kinase/response regulator